MRTTTSVFETMRHEAKLLREGPPGERFETRYRRHRSAPIAHRVASLAAGLVLLTAGVFMIPLPGPGWVVSILGLGLLGGESLRISRLLDRLERAAQRQRRRHWDRVSKRQRWLLAGTVAALGGATVLGVSYATYRLRDQIPFM